MNLPVTIEHNVPARMRDGVTLYADIYRPLADTPLPVILMRTPYDKTLALDAGHKPALWFARQGYIVVIQDTRGRFASEGEFYPFRYEMEDGYDTVEWAARLPGSNGKVGMYGFSYVGATQLLAAVMQPPHLTCIAPGFTASDYYDGWTYRGGALSLAFAVSWALGLAFDDAIKQGRPEVARDLQQMLQRLPEGYWYLPLSELPLLRQNHLAPYFFDWLAHPTWDEYWKRWSIRTRYAQIQVPALHCGGWYDVFLEGTLENFRGIRAQGATETARKGQRLLVGPWIHSPWTSRVGELDFGPAAANPVDDAIIRFFDYWLKGIDNGVGRELPVGLFVMGENKWRYENDFPPRRARPYRYYLHSTGRANSLNGDGALDLNPPGEEPSDGYNYDPFWSVPSRGGQSCCEPQLAPMGPYDQREIEARNDVLVYSTPPLEHDLEVCGTVTATLYASSTARDTDFIVKLVDVFPDGRAINLCEGMLRTRYRSGLEQPQPIEPEVVYEYQIVVGSTCNLFRAGHRLRIDISSGSFPMYDRNPGHGGEIARATLLDFHAARQQVFHDARYPSHITLPIIER